MTEQRRLEKEEPSLLKYMRFSLTHVCPGNVFGEKKSFIFCVFRRKRINFLPKLGLTIWEYLNCTDSGSFSFEGVLFTKLAVSCLTPGKVSLVNEDKSVLRLFFHEKLASVIQGLASERY